MAQIQVEKTWSNKKMQPMLMAESLRAQAINPSKHLDTKALNVLKF